MHRLISMHARALCVLGPLSMRLETPRSAQNVIAGGVNGHVLYSICHKANGVWHMSQDTSLHCVGHGGQ